MGHKKPVIGLVGGIGSGKTLVSQQLESLGCSVISADQLAQEALDSSQIQEELKRWWGPDIIGADGLADRKKIGTIVFSNSTELKRLEQLVHPMVKKARSHLRKQYEQDENTVAIVEDCPLLIETGLDQECDAIIFISCSYETRLERVAANRKWSKEELAQREKNQLKLDIKAKRADYIINNDTSEEDCFLQVRRVLSQVIQALS